MEIEQRATMIGLSVEDSGKARAFYESWGGYRSTFHDLDGYFWEVAYNPYLVLYQSLKLLTHFKDGQVRRHAAALALSYRPCEHDAEHQRNGAKLNRCGETFLRLALGGV